VLEFKIFFLVKSHYRNLLGNLIASKDAVFSILPFCFFQFARECESEIVYQIRKKYFQVAKNRYAGDLGLMPLMFTKSVLSFSRKVADQQRRQVAKQRRPTTLITGEGAEQLATRD
jgi:hypothetical protein